MTSNGAFAQFCEVIESQFVRSPTLNQPSRFGHAVAIEGDFAVVGARDSSQFTNGGGAAYIMHRDREGQWNISQTLGAGIVDGAIRFGESVAIDGSIAVVCATRKTYLGSVSAGAAYVYRLNAGDWELEAQLVSSDPNTSDEFGSSVAVLGDVIVVGAWQDDEAASNAGAAYVFRNVNGTWRSEQKLVQSSASSSNNLGRAVVIQPDMIVAGRNNAAVAFQRSETFWSQSQVLVSPDSSSTDSFGTGLGIDGPTLAIGAPAHDLPGATDAGAVYVFTLNDGVWSFAQKLTMATPRGSDRFGSAIAVERDVLVVGAPNRDVHPVGLEPDTFDAGIIEVFNRSRLSVWTRSFLGKAKHRISFNSFDDMNERDLLGFSVGISGSTILAGGPHPSGNSEIMGKVLSFSTTPSDCDDDGTPDACDFDCDGNSTSDHCAILKNALIDCDSDGQLDACEQGPEYVIANPLTSSVIWGPAGNALDYMWMNQFFVQDGAQVLSHVGVGWAAIGGHDGLTGMVVVYDDPNNDGDPSDAVLLSTAPARVYDNVSSVGELSSVFPIPATYVGNPGDSFFVGVFMVLPPAGNVAVSDAATTAGHSNWRIAALAGTGNIRDLSTGWTRSLNIGDFIISAYALDCNSNSTWDRCDISAGTSTDFNANGVPDECETPPCKGDINGSHSVDVADLLMVIANWGACLDPNDCPADVNNDEQVNVGDLLLVITHWGLCG